MESVHDQYGQLTRTVRGCVREVRATVTSSPGRPSTRLHTTCRGFCGLYATTTSPATANGGYQRSWQVCPGLKAKRHSSKAREAEP